MPPFFFEQDVDPIHDLDSDAYQQVNGSLGHCAPLFG
jgi:hypothetical protein